MDYMELDFELAVKRAFHYTSDYDKWKLIVSEDCLYAVNLERRKEFVDRLNMACYNARIPFTSLWGDVIWEYPIYADDCEQKLEEFEAALLEIKGDTLKSLVRMTKNGSIKYFL